MRSEGAFKDAGKWMAAEYSRECSSTYTRHGDGKEGVVKALSALPVVAAMR
jgi:hypothetical protein